LWGAMGCNCTITGRGEGEEGRCIILPPIDIPTVEIFRSSKMKKECKTFNII